MEKLRVMLIVALLSSCGSLHRQMPPGFDRQGHRGCRGLMPENTIPAMIKAVQLGVNTIEMDVVFTSDLKAILSHDPFFNHNITTRPDGSFIEEKLEKEFNLYKMTYDEIRKYDVGSKLYPTFPGQEKMKVAKPLLADVINAVESYITRNHLKPVRYNIETKTKLGTDNLFHPTPEVFVNELMKVLIEKQIMDKVIIQSFDVRTLKYLHNKYPSVTTSLLIEPAEMISISRKIKTLGFAPDIVSPDYHMVNVNVVSDLHQKNIRIIPWTVNDKIVIDDMISIGVDGIITDYPDLF